MATKLALPEIPTHVVDRAFEIVAEYDGAAPFPAIMSLAEARTRRNVDGQPIINCDERTLYFDALVKAMFARGATWTSAARFTDRTVNFTK